MHQHSGIDEADICLVHDGLRMVGSVCFRRLAVVLDGGKDSEPSSLQTAREPPTSGEEIDGGQSTLA